MSVAAALEKFRRNEMRKPSGEALGILINAVPAL
jgi:hypothetical protein